MFLIHSAVLEIPKTDKMHMKLKLGGRTKRWKLTGMMCAETQRSMFSFVSASNSASVSTTPSSTGAGP